MTQHMDALAQAQAIRLAHAAFRREIAALSQREGMGIVAAALDDPGEMVGRMRLTAGRYPLVPAIRGFGAASAERLIRRAGASGGRRVCDLTERQRKVLSVALRSPAGAGSGKREAA